MMIKTIIISMLTMIFSYYYQLMIDSFSKYPIYQIVFISLGFTVLYAFKLLLDYLRRQQILELSRELNQEYALKTMQNLIYQDYSEGGQMVWNGLNRNGDRVKTGVYLVFASSSNGKEGVVTKILIVN